MNLLNVLNIYALEFANINRLTAQTRVCCLDKQVLKTIGFNFFMMLCTHVSQPNRNL